MPRKKAHKFNYLAMILEVNRDLLEYFLLIAKVIIFVCQGIEGLR